MFNLINVVTGLGKISEMDEQDNFLSATTVTVGFGVYLELMLTHMAQAWLCVQTLAEGSKRHDEIKRRKWMMWSVKDEHVKVKGNANEAEAQGNSSRDCRKWMMQNQTILSQKTDVWILIVTAGGFSQ